MYSNKLELPRRGRSFDSMNIGFEEKQLNNEVRTVTIRIKRNKLSYTFNLVSRMGLKIKFAAFYAYNLSASGVFTHNFLTSLIIFNCRQRRLFNPYCYNVLYVWVKGYFPL